MSKAIKWLKADLNDKPYLLQLRRLTMTEHLESSGLFDDDETYEDRVMYGFDTAHLLYHGDEVFGLLKLKVVSDEVKITQIQVHPDYQGQGLGRRVIEQLFAQYPQHDFVLTVLKTNPAKALYQRLGFEQYGEDEYEFFMRRVNGAGKRIVSA